MSASAPTLIARRFEENRQIPEARVKKMLEDVLASPEVPRVAALVQKRLGRKLEPFDIWYDGFRARGKYTEAQLDEIVRKKYPTAEAYQKDIPSIYQTLAQYFPVGAAVGSTDLAGPHSPRTLRVSGAHSPAHPQSSDGLGVSWRG